MSRSLPFILIAYFLLGTPNIRAQYPKDEPYKHIIAKTPKLPEYLSTLIDTTLPDPISITRITRFNTKWNWYPIHEYAKIQPWNADASLYKFYSVALYDAQTHLLYRKLPGSSIYPSYWSNKDPDILYGIKENGEIRTYSISRDTIETLLSIEGYEMVKLGPGEGNIDQYDHFVALIGKKGVDLDVLIIDLQAHKLIHTEHFKGVWADGGQAPKYIDWVSVSPSGDYVGIMWNHNTTSKNHPFDKHYGVEIYRSKDMHFLRRIADYGNHGDFGYATDGAEVFVQFWGPTGTINMYYLDRMENIVLQTASDFAGEGHISCRNLNRPGWAYVSQDENTRQIIACRLDRSGIVEHFGHHFSSATSYLKSPMPVPSPNGDKVMFKSDFGHSENQEEIYVFEAQLYDLTSHTSSKESNDNPKMHLSPNPASKSTLHIQYGEAINKISIVDLMGNTRIYATPDKKEKYILNINSLPTGLFFLLVEDKKGNRCVKKFMRTKLE